MNKRTTTDYNDKPRIPQFVSLSHVSLRVRQPIQLSYKCACRVEHTSSWSPISSSLPANQLTCLSQRVSSSHDQLHPLWYWLVISKMTRYISDECHFSAKPCWMNHAYIKSLSTQVIVIRYRLSLISNVTLIFKVFIIYDDYLNMKRCHDHSWS